MLLVLASLLGSHFRYLGLDHEGKSNSGKCYLGTVYIPGTVLSGEYPPKPKLTMAGRCRPKTAILSPTTLLI